MMVGLRQLAESRQWSARIDAAIVSIVLVGMSCILLDVGAARATGGVAVALLCYVYYSYQRSLANQ